VGIRCADHATLFRKKLALTSPTIGGHAAGIVRSRSKATELVRLDFVHRPEGSYKNSVFPSYLEFQAIDNFHKPSDSVYLAHGFK
jgi:hypothetical protein